MKIKPFAVEEWMNAYETGARYNIAETCVDSVSLKELFKLCGEDIDFFRQDFMQRRLTYSSACLNRKNSLNTIQFTLCLLIARLMLPLWGSATGPALHEALPIIFRFVGDYLLEFIPVSRADNYPNKNADK